jgi:hypothetical protein
MDSFHAALDWINCHLRFPLAERTLEAYGAWFAAVFASAAVLWTWRSFNAQSDILREQQRATFLTAVRPQYHAGFADYAVWIGREVPLEFRSDRPDQGLPKKAMPRAKP